MLMIHTSIKSNKHICRDGQVVASVGASKRLLRIKNALNLVTNLSQKTFLNPQLLTLFAVLVSSFLKLIESIELILYYSTPVPLHLGNSIRIIPGSAPHFEFKKPERTTALTLTPCIFGSLLSPKTHFRVFRLGQHFPGRLTELKREAFLSARLRK